MPEIDQLARLIYDESVRGLDMQSSTLDELRSRTGVLIAASTVASAFLGATAFARHHVTQGTNLAALIVFGLTVALCLLVLLPSTKWAFVYSPQALDDAYFVKRVDPTLATRSIALGHAKTHDANKHKLKWRYFWFRLACVTLIADIALWTISIGVR